MEDKRSKVCAIVVIYNAKFVVRQCLDSLLRQSYPLDKIFLVDNASRDGTEEFLRQEGYLSKPKVAYYKLSVNVGPDGGFYAGLKMAYQEGFDYFWLFDQDAGAKDDALAYLLAAAEEFPAQKACFNSSHLAPGGIYFSEPIFIAKTAANSDKRPIFTTPDGVAYIEIERYEELRGFGELVEGHGAVYAGLFLPRQALTSAFPNPEYFYDGFFEFCRRLRQRGFPLYYSTKSIVFHPRLAHGYKTLFWGPTKRWKIYFYRLRPAWKYYYQMRNGLIMRLGRRSERHGINFLVRFFKAVPYCLFRLFVVISMDKNRLPAFKYCMLGFWDGFNERLINRFTL